MQRRIWIGVVVFLGIALLFLRDFEHDLGFLGGGIVFSHSSDYILFWPVFVSGFWGPLY